MEITRTPRTAAATAAARRNAERRRAAHLRERGWICIDTKDYDVQVRQNGSSIVYVVSPK